MLIPHDGYRGAGCCAPGFHVKRAGTFLELHIIYRYLLYRYLSGSACVARCKTGLGKERSRHVVSSSHLFCFVLECYCFGIVDVE